MLSLSETNSALAVLTLWTGAFVAYNRVIRPLFRDPVRGDPLSRLRLFRLPTALRCVVPLTSTRPENDCRDEAVDGWTLAHLAIWATVGLYVKRQYLAVLLASVLFEAWEWATDWRARWVLDPLTNVTGYALGAMIGTTQPSLLPAAWSDSWWTTVGMSGVILGLLRLNLPDALANSQIKL